MNKAFYLGALALSLAGLPLSTALAGDENTLILLQEGTGNTISIDQQTAIGSQIGGVNFVEKSAFENSEFEVLDLSNPLNFNEASNHPILQLGDNNSANITIEGQDDVVYLQQNSQGQAPGNNADIYVNSGAGAPSFAAVVQTGAGNNAEVSIDGSLSNGTILQNGSDNNGSITVDGNNVTAALTQVGSNNDSQLVAQGNATSATGVDGANVTYTLYANGVTTTQPVTVSTNGASVSITQIQF
nr:hypothetical protein [uncultured Cohaesibacter sp.]